MKPHFVRSIVENDLHTFNVAEGVRKVKSECVAVLHILGNVGKSQKSEISAKTEISPKSPKSVTTER